MNLVQMDILIQLLRHVVQVGVVQLLEHVTNVVQRLINMHVVEPDMLLVKVLLVMVSINLVVVVLDIIVVVQVAVAHVKQHHLVRLVLSSGKSNFQHVIVHYINMMICVAVISIVIYQQVSQIVWGDVIIIVLFMKKVVVVTK